MIYFRKDTAEGSAVRLWWLFLTVFLVSALTIKAQHYKLKELPAPPAKSLRGLSVVSDAVLWASGTEGQVGRSINGGRTWEWQQIKECPGCDWRSLYAFDDQEAIILNAGSPAFIFKTTDGGHNWQQVYTDTAAAIFFDGIQFGPPNHGIAIGDPIANKFIVIQTQNKGNSWKRLPVQDLPAATEGEALFAASGTSLIQLPSGRFCFVTGGTVSRIWMQENNWQAYTLPLIQGKSTTGAFSAAFVSDRQGIVVGGDYQQPDSQQGNCALTYDGGKHWMSATKPPGGYRSCVAYLTDKILIATGTNGTDVSTDGGKNWNRVGNGFNVVAKARNGKAVYLAGSKIAKLEGF